MIADIAIAGGGPAGAFAALLLARAGASVILIDGGRPADRIEGLSPRVLAILTGHGIDPEGVGPAVLRQVRWGALDAAQNREHPVRRPAFDEGLRAAAARSGVQVISGRTIRTLKPGRVELEADPEIRAGLVFDARGRRAPVQTGALRGPPGVAVAAWTGPAASPAAVIEALPDGWVWQAAVPEVGTWTQVVVDASDLAPGKAALGEAWHRATATSAPDRMLSRASELRLTAPELDPDRPALGDAAIAMDPLSGHGIFWALSSALGAPPLADSLLGGEPERAAAFYRQRVVETFWRQARIGRDFHRLAGRDTGFWRTRAAWPDDLPAHPRIEAPYLDRRVVVKHGRLTDADVLITDREPGGAAFVFGHEVGPILRRLDGLLLPDCAVFCSQIVPEISPQNARNIYEWLTDRGIPTQPRRDERHPRTENSPC